MKYSFVVPIYNDAHLAEEFCIQFQKTFTEYLKKSDITDAVELLFVNDGSKNNSFEKLVGLSSKYSFVKLINLSRNFGQHIALTAGYAHASGEYVGMLNVDCEDPPSQIPKLLTVIESGQCDIVTSLRTNRKSSWINKITSLFFHWMLNKLTGAEMPINCSTLRVMNRKFVNAYNLLSERERYIPGLEWWLGFNHGYVEIEQQESLRGGSTYSLRRRLTFAFKAILSFSILPLRFSVFGGFCVAFIGFILGVYLVFSKIFFIDYQPGYTSTLCVLIFLGGLQILVIGTVGLYVGRILEEVKNRPVYIVKDLINFPRETRH